jgi:hypothetical protein
MQPPSELPPASSQPQIPYKKNNNIAILLVLLVVGVILAAFFSCGCVGFLLLFSRSSDQINRTPTVAKADVEAEAANAESPFNTKEELARFSVEKAPAVNDVDQIRTPTATIADLQQILLEYNADYNEADKKFKGKLLQISGVVEKDPLESDGSHSTYITLDNGAVKSKYRVVLYFGDSQQRVEVRKLSKGQRVTVQGRFDGLDRPIFFGNVEDSTLITMGVGGGECKLIK